MRKCCQKVLWHWPQDNNFIAIFSLPVQSTGFEPSISGLRVEFSTTVLRGHSQVSRYLWQRQKNRFDWKWREEIMLLWIFRSTSCDFSEKSFIKFLFWNASKIFNRLWSVIPPSALGFIYTSSNISAFKHCVFDCMEILKRNIVWFSTLVCLQMSRQGYYRLWKRRAKTHSEIVRVNVS